MLKSSHWPKGSSEEGSGAEKRQGVTCVPGGRNVNVGTAAAREAGPDGLSPDIEIMVQGVAGS